MEQFVGFSDARKSPAEDYWKEVVKGQTMPQDIRERIRHHLQGHRFSMDFDTSENAIIYHGRRHSDHKEIMIINSTVSQKGKLESNQHKDEAPEAEKYT